MHQSCFAYIRVSTQKQGQHGVSLAEQRAAIERFADQTGLTIVEWFEERETAAKSGRAVFNSMLKQLRHGRVRTVIIHKIDRSARNLKDWADLGELIDNGVSVHFATESLDLQSRGGRLSADIQAVVAADFIRNLREETRKGFYGRLKQGLYPLAAPIGYLDCGGGKAKIPDPERGLFIRTAFELYATGEFSLHTLRDELTRRGLRNTSGKELSVNGLSVVLNNPFYAGLIRLKTTGETFQGIHEPLISMSCFDAVQDILRGKTARRRTRHSFLFQKLLTCGYCGHLLIGERQKGHIYYRCHTKACQTRSVREESIKEQLCAKFEPLQISASDADIVRAHGRKWSQGSIAQSHTQREGLTLQLEKVTTRYDRLVDAYVDAAIDKEAYERRKATLLADQVRIESRLRDLDGKGDTLEQDIERYLVAAQQPFLGFDTADGFDCRELLKELTSNRTVYGKSLAVELNSPFSALENDEVSRLMTFVGALIELFSCDANKSIVSIQ